MLDIGHPLYKMLPTLSFWERLKQDPDIYMEIRKNNVVDAYYYGAKIAEITYNESSGKIDAKCHRLYIGETSTPGNQYVSCVKHLQTSSKLNVLKKNALTYYVKTPEGEDTSEKRIQGRLRLDNDHIYIDSEFEHQLEHGTKNTIRFDLVSIKNNELRIVELKRLCDNRLLTSDIINHPPEILTQISNYEDFIATNSFALIQYYEVMATIRRQLGLSVPTGFNERKPLTINPKPLLIIKNLYQYNKMNKQRHHRISQIKSLLSDNNIEFEILP